MAMWDLTTLIFDKLFSDYFFSTDKIAQDDIELKTSSVMGAFIKMNDKFSHTWFKNATMIEFNSIYPNIILSIMNKKQNEGIKFNMSNFHRIFATMMNERKRVKEMMNDTNIDTFKNVYAFIKIWINMTYGILHTDKSYLRCNENIGLLVNARAYNLLRNIYNDFEGHILYIDTDFVIFRYFNEVSNRFKKFMEHPLYSDIPWNEEKVSFYIEKLKKYICQDSTGALYIHGLKQKDVS